jgi:hypothetical protein
VNRAFVTFWLLHLPRPEKAGKLESFCTIAQCRNGQWTLYWGRQRWWYKLAQVSRRWRYVILGSPLRLDLHLVCTYRVPVAGILAHSPPLPLTVFYADLARKMTAEDEEGLQLALSHRDRVHHVTLRMPAPQLGKFIPAMEDQFPTLERLYMGSPIIEGTCLILPQSFQAPNLRHFSLWSIALPMRPPILTTTGGLVYLRLVGIPRSAYFPLGYLLTRLALMLQLELLVISFHSPVPNWDVIKQLSEIPTMTHVTLSNLREFYFAGVSTYLEGLLEWITGGFRWAECFKIGRMPSVRQQLRLEVLEEETPYCAVVQWYLRPAIERPQGPQR